MNAALIALALLGADYNETLATVQVQGGAAMVIMHRGGESERQARLFMASMDETGINHARGPVLLDLRRADSVPRIWNIPSSAFEHTAYIGTIKRYRFKGRTIATGLRSTRWHTPDEIMQWWVNVSRRHTRHLAWEFYDDAPREQ